MINICSVQMEKRSSDNKKKLYEIDGELFTAENAIIRYFSKKGFQGIWAENKYWWIILCVLFWDQIFARISGAVGIVGESGIDEPEPGSQEFERLFDYVIESNGMPVDFFMESFYGNRRSIIENRIEELKDIDLKGEFISNYRLHYGSKCRPIEDWDAFSLDQIVIVFKYLSNAQVLKILHRLITNFKKNRAGLPDLIVFNDSCLKFVEVKSENDKLIDRQIEWHKYIASETGIDVEIILINADNDKVNRTSVLYQDKEPSKRGVAPEKRSLATQENWIIKELRGRVKGRSLLKQYERHGDLAVEIEEKKQAGNYRVMLRLCEESLMYIEGTIKYEEKLYDEKWDGTWHGRFAGIEEACIYLPIFGSLEELEYYRDFVFAIPKIAYYQENIEKAFLFFDIITRLRAKFYEVDEIKQKDLKKLLNISDGRSLSRVVHYLEKVGNVTRLKEGDTYLIYWPEIRRERRRLQEKNLYEHKLKRSWKDFLSRVGRDFSRQR